MWGRETDILCPTQSRDILVFCMELTILLCVMRHIQFFENALITYTHMYICKYIYVYILLYVNKRRGTALFLIHHSETISWNTVINSHVEWFGCILIFLLMFLESNMLGDWWIEILISFSLLLCFRFSFIWCLARKSTVWLSKSATVYTPGLACLVWLCDKYHCSCD